MESGIDETARRAFEQAWQEGQAAAIESFLPESDDPRYLPTLEELVHVELELAWKSRRAKTGLLAAGEASDSAGPLVESYLIRFPALKQPPIVRRLIEQEYWARCRFGDRPDRQSYGPRFQDLDLSTLTWEDQSSEASVTIPVRRGNAAPQKPLAIAGYEIIKELGRGGMGVVYKARQLSLNRIVAIKMVLGGSLAGEEELRRFRAEAQVIASLQHPNIVQIHEIGQHENGAYLSLEFIDGPTLAQKLDHKPQAPKAAARLLETLARAMEQVHAQGIIHRDLKPANVMMCHDGTPKITDFGLAKQLQPTQDGPEASLGGRVIGTPSYASPEQAAGRTAEITSATDVYALGSILYEMLTGRPPFQGTSAMGTMMQVLQQEPVPPSRLQPKLPRDLETICLKCLQKQARKRYASAAELADDLHRFSQGKPILARPVSSAERAWRWSQRNPLLATMSAGAIASLIAVAVVSSVFSVRLQRTLDVVTEQRAAVQRVSTTMALGRGLMLCRQNLPQEGLLWLARGVEIAPPELGDLRWALRLNIAAWSTEIPAARPRRLSFSGMVAVTAWTSDGRRVLTGTRDGQIHLWDAASGTGLDQFFDAGTPINTIALSPDNRVLASGGEDGLLHLWDLNSGQPIGLPLGQGGAIRILQFSGDGSLLASGSDAGVARLWDGRSGQSIGDAMAHAGAVNAVAFSPDDRRLAVSGGKKAELWDTQTYQFVVRATTQFGNIGALAFRGNDKLLTWASDVSGRAACEEWDAATGLRLRKVFERIGEPSLLPGVAVFSPDGEWMLVKASDSGKPHFVRIATAEPVGPAMDHGELGVGQIMTISRDGRVAATVGMDSAVRIWEVVTARQIGPPIQQEGPIRCLKFSPDANRLLTSSGGNAACVWELAAAVSWPPFQELGDASPALATQGSNACVALSPDDRTTATASADGMIRIFNTANGTTQRVIGPLPAPVLALAFSPDGSLLLSGAADSRAPSAAGEAIFWQTASGQPLGPPLRHRAAVRCVAFSPDGKLALTGSDDQTAQLWSVAVGCSIGRAMQHPGEVEHVEFRSDGRQLTTVCLAKPTRRAALAAQNLDMDGTAETRPASHNAESPPARLTRTWPVPAPAADDAQTLVGRVKAMTGLELGPSDALQGIKSP